jgi:hypothetical protein
MKNSIADIQLALNRFIQDDYQMEVDCLSIKVERMYGKEDQTRCIKEELDEFVERLGGCYESDYWALNPLKPYIYDDDFLEKGGFLSVLLPDERDKWINFKANIDSEFEYESYSWELPYFQSIKDFVYFYRYVDYLRERLKELEGVEVVPVRKSENATKRTLEARLTEAQLSLLLDCVNELHLFATPITADDLLSFFNCTLQSPLKLARTKNKLFIYLLWQLESRGYITMEWQSACAKERLIESCTFTNSAFCPVPVLSLLLKATMT